MKEPIQITITGRPYSKKNSREPRRGRSRRTGKLYTYMAPGDNYETFKAAALYQLKAYKVKFQGAIEMEYIFYRKGKELQDVDNAMASINDVLQDAGIIENDKYILKGKFAVVPGQSAWSTSIVIRELDLTPGYS